MLKQSLIIIVVCLFSSSVFSQAGLLNASTVDQIGKKSVQQKAADGEGPIPYGFVNDRDIMWSKVVWEFIDLNQKINLPYYYPIDTTNTDRNRKSLFDTLLKGVRKNRIKNVYSDSFFNSKMTEADINSRLVNVREENGYTDTFRVQAREIGGYMIKGMWYFDKRQGELKYRLLALAPMGNDVQTLGVSEIEDKNLYELFWVFYPETRALLHDTKVFNPGNALQRTSFDEMLNARRFNSVIVREENIYDNRAIEDYIKGNSLRQLLEANKIKESIRNKEMDMWNY